MSLTDGTGLSATDIMALTGNNDGFGSGFGGGGWWIILFILLIFGGWGGNRAGWGNGGGGADAATMAMPYMYAGVQQGFDQSAVMTALTNLNNAINLGFGNAAVDSCNKTMTLMQGQNQITGDIAQLGYNTLSTINGSANSLSQQMMSNEMARQQCCCDNKMAIADLKATLLAEHCADRADIASAMNDIETRMAAGFQSIKDQLFQSQLDAVKAENDALKMQAYMNGLAASQNAQTQALVANNQAQTDRIMDFINPGYSRPFYGWSQNGCSCNQNVGCCGNA